MPLKLSSKGAKSKFIKEEAKAKAAAVDIFISNFSTQADELIVARNVLIHPISKDILDLLVAADVESINSDPNIRQSISPHVAFAISVLDR